MSETTLDRAIRLRQANLDMTGTAIARECGVSRQRIQQILARAGLKIGRASIVKTCRQCGASWNGMRGQFVLCRQCWRHQYTHDRCTCGQEKDRRAKTCQQCYDKAHRQYDDAELLALHASGGYTALQARYPGKSYAALAAQVYRARRRLSAR